MDCLSADQILYIKKRRNSMAEGEIKAAIEYRAEHGPANLLVMTQLSDSVYQLPEIPEAASVETIKYLEAEDGSWQVIIRGRQTVVALSIATEELKIALERNSISLPQIKS